MELPVVFESSQLAHIIEQAMLCMCACPAQVAEQIRHLRQMIRYQNNCAIQEDTDTVVHKSIAKAGLQAHAILEDCMDEILELEGWDRETLRMPEGLRRMRDELINKG